MPRTKQAVTYRLEPQLLARLQAIAADRHWKIVVAVEVLLEDALTRAGYPPPEPEKPHHAV